MNFLGRIKLTQFSRYLFYLMKTFLCLQDIIRHSEPMKNEMEHQLYVYQCLIFRSLLVDFILTKGNAQNQVSVELL